MDRLWKVKVAESKAPENTLYEKNGDNKHSGENDVCQNSQQDGENEQSCEKNVKIKIKDTVKQLDKVESKKSTL